MHHQQEASALRGQSPLALSLHGVHRPNAARQVESRLRQSSHGELRRIHCEFHEGAVVLRGKVSSFYLKQMAQTFAARTPGVQEVVNRIEVREVKHASA